MLEQLKSIAHIHLRQTLDLLLVAAWRKSKQSENFMNKTMILLNMKSVSLALTSSRWWTATASRPSTLTNNKTATSLALLWMKSDTLTSTAGMEIGQCLGMHLVLTVPATTKLTRIWPIPRNSTTSTRTSQVILCLDLCCHLVNQQERERSWLISWRRSCFHASDNSRTNKHQINSWKRKSTGSSMRKTWFKFNFNRV